MQNILFIKFLNESELIHLFIYFFIFILFIYLFLFFFFLHTVGFKYFYLTRIIRFTINHC